MLLKLAIIVSAGVTAGQHFEKEQTSILQIMINGWKTSLQAARHEATAKPILP